MASPYSSTTEIGLQISHVKHNAIPKRDVSSVLIIENSDVTFKNSSEIKRNFAKWFPNKKLLYAFRTNRGHIHLEFESPQESIETENTWQPHFLGSETTCYRPRTNRKLFSVLIKDVPKDPEFSDENITQSLTKDFSGAKAQRFFKRDKTILNTVKIAMPKQSDL